MLVNWVAVFSPLPVIAQDEGILVEKGNYGNYDAHFVPVYSPNHPNTTNYHAIQYGQDYQYTELVVFDSAQVLPFYMVELQRSLIQNPAISSPTTTSSSTSELSLVISFQNKPIKQWDHFDVQNWIQSLKLSREYVFGLFCFFACFIFLHFFL